MFQICQYADDRGLIDKTLIHLLLEEGLYDVADRHQSGLHAAYQQWLNGALRNKWTAEISNIWVLFEDLTPVGVATLEVNRVGVKRGQFYVNPPFRKRGYGTALVLAVKAEHPTFIGSATATSKRIFDANGIAYPSLLNPGVATIGINGPQITPVTFPFVYRPTEAPQ
jgi:GNAT superfamily N-acetyltransferase